MQEYTTYINSLHEHPLIIAAIGQFIFEKIHPFADGNGRTGRLISTYLLTKAGFDFEGLIPIEKYINEHRSWYYQTLEPSSNCSEFIDFFLESLSFQANYTLDELKNPIENTASSNLLPRRRELLEVIKDHPESSFDFLHRRFMNQSPLSLHRDLKHLMQKELIKKLGSTRGAVYVAV
jgi:Fic family protein